MYDTSHTITGQSKAYFIKSTILAKLKFDFGLNLTFVKQAGTSLAPMLNTPLSTYIYQFTSIHSSTFLAQSS